MNSWRELWHLSVIWGELCGRRQAFPTTPISSTPSSKDRSYPPTTENCFLCSDLSSSCWVRFDLNKELQKCRYFFFDETITLKHKLTYLLFHNNRPSHISPIRSLQNYSLQGNNFCAGLVAGDVEKLGHQEVLSSQSVWLTSLHTWCCSSENITEAE